jgi:excisionase family DNA binding protein
MSSTASVHDNPPEAESPRSAAKRAALAPLFPGRLLRYREFCALTGIGLSKAKELVLSGRVRSVRIDSARRIPISEVDRIEAEGLR